MEMFLSGCRIQICFQYSIWVFALSTVSKWVMMVIRSLNLIFVLLRIYGVIRRRRFLGRDFLFFHNELRWCIFFLAFGKNFSFNQKNGNLCYNYFRPASAICVAIILKCFSSFAPELHLGLDSKTPSSKACNVFILPCSSSLN